MRGSPSDDPWMDIQSELASQGHRQHATTAASGETAGASASSPQIDTDSGTSTSATNDIQPPSGGAVEKPVTPREPTGEPELPGERAAEGALIPTRGMGASSS